MRKNLFRGSMILLILAFVGTLSAAELKVGTARVDITPEKKVPLWGQMNLRISEGIKSRITANVCAVEATEKGKADSVIFVSMDVVHIPTAFAKIVREKIEAKDPTIDSSKVILFAIHTHTAPTLYIGTKLPERDDLEDYPETIDNISTKIADGVVEAWKKRVPANFSWGLEEVVIGQSRRVCYMDGHTVMYGQTNDPEFSHLENPSDPDLGTIFFWDKDGKLLSVIINVACPSQVVENLSVLCADYWGVAREKLYERFGEDVVIVACNSPAGDDAPHPQYRQKAIRRTLSLRYGANDLGDAMMMEIARRIDRAVADAYECALKDIATDPTFEHRVETLSLPMRQVTKEQYETAKANQERVLDEVKNHPEKSEAEVSFMEYGWYDRIVRWYEGQQKGEWKTFPATIHVIRLGSTAIATDQFELFVDYGMRIKARSPANYTFVMDMSDGDGYYLPTEKAIAGGGYSTIIQSAPVGAEGGQVLVNETLRIIQEIWDNYPGVDR